MNTQKLINFINTNDESEILDYKENLKDAHQIGEYISALGNSALLSSSPAAYIVWGVKDMSKKIVGTDFEPYKTKAKGNIPLTTYLGTMVDPRVNLDWDELEIDGKKVVLLTIDVEHIFKPIAFGGTEFIRIGTSKKNLKGFPEKERRLWKSFESTKFELEFAITGIPFEKVSALLALDYYQQRRNIPSPANENLVSFLISDRVITQTDINSFNITNLGAYTLAKKIANFPTLERRTIRITSYKGNQRLENAFFNRNGQMGIAVSFDNVIKNIMNLIPYEEDYSGPTRKDIPLFPMIAVRELVANALVHQDFSLTGSRPSIEIFDSRLEVSNPGTPLIDPNRFLDFQPKSRNDELAGLLGKLNIVESRGTGIDKIVNSLEKFDLPAMDIKVQGSESTIITLHTKKDFKDMSTTEKTQAIYWHSCLKYVADEQINNASLRARFRLSSNETTAISKAINNAMESGYIKPYDPNAGKRFVKYIPFWGRDVSSI
ncbi:ATP-binding protein [Liquorilactobacillus satsumensis]|uniref:ATP-binding protein n=1 Tax=Liquorilactobacillus satsumensis TaxID=259059 RepID=UPI0039ED2BC7